ncbi:MAG: hypothetical protein QGG74_00195, partial [Phycisphaerales bacterium]|nr:hypothetical protein [Phycisphaerales bacterium]
MRWRRNTELDGRLPRQVMSAWPRNTPLAMLHTNPSGDSGRWSVLGVPRGHLEAAATHGTWRGPDKPELAGAASRCALAAIEAIDGQRATIDAPEGAPPFAGWIACLHYELGEILEPAVRGDVGGGTTALLSMLWCPDALLHDRVSGQWWSTGSPPKPAMTSLLGEEMLTTTPPTSTPSAADWPAAVARGVEYIRAGDIFQVNLTRQLTVD